MVRTGEIKGIEKLSISLTGESSVISKLEPQANTGLEVSTGMLLEQISTI